MVQPLRQIAVLVSALCVLVVASDAEAQRRRVVVLPIEDAPNATLRKNVVSILRSGRHTVISAKTFNKTARKLRARTMTSDNLVRVSRRLRADGVLSGSVTEERGRYYLRLHLRSGKTGETVQKLRLRLRRARLNKKIRRQLRRQLLAAVKQLAPPTRRKPRRNTGGGDEIEVVSGVRAATKKTARNNKKTGTQSGDGQNRVAKVKPGNGQGGNGQGGNGQGGNSQGGNGDRQSLSEAPGSGGSQGGTGPEETVRGSLARKPPAKVRRAADIRVGASLVQRNLTFVLVEQFPEAPNGYQGPAAPGLSVAGDFYPLELTGLAGTLLAAPGFAFRYDTVIGLQTAIDTGGGVLATAATAQTHYSIGGRLRFRFASLPTKPTIIFGFGTGQLEFMVDPNGVPAGVVLDVPNTTYKFFDPGAWLKLAVHPRFAIEVGGQALLVTDAGEVQQAEQYGGANITSYSVDVGLEFRATPNWRLRAAGKYTSLGLEFLGNGEQTFGRDGDPGTVDVLGAQDSYVTGSIALGYVY